MKLKNNKSGFTLLEIIIVIIIVGVLASLALPQFFTTVEFSRSTEALNSIGVVKRAADRCALMGGDTDDYSDCTTTDELGIGDPGASRGAHFSYDLDWTSPDFMIIADRNTLDGDEAAGDWVYLIIETDTDIIKRGGTGAYSGLK